MSNKTPQSQEGKYYYERNANDIYDIRHSSGEHIAKAPDAEKADFLVKAANYYSIDLHVTDINVGDIPTHSEGQETKEEGWNLASVSPKMLNEQVSQTVLCQVEAGNVVRGYLENGIWIYEFMGRSFESYGGKVTHWRYLPNPPEDKETN
jgi:hypothetical protein